MNKQPDLKEVLNNLQNEKLTIDIILLCETYLNANVCKNDWYVWIQYDL